MKDHARNRHREHSRHGLALTTGIAAARSQQTITALRRFDPNFSEITFGDVCYSLYARAHNVRGEGKLDPSAPDPSADARGALASLNPPALREVRGVVIGSFKVESLFGLDTPVVQAEVSFESNYTEVAGAPNSGVETSWYARERWLLERKRDILSPPPAKAKADHCPHCGAALSTRTDGSCEYRGVRIADGSFNWYVRSIALIGRDERGPLLTSDVPEEGTSRETILQPLLDQQRAAFQKAHPEFRWETFDARVRQVATELQNAWSSLQWESVRPLETDGLFQMHRYWIDAYARQHPRNLVDDYKIQRVDVVKVKSDAFYEAVTVRLWAQGRDHNDAEDGRIVAGSKNLRRWSEYWTFVRVHGAGGTEPRSCPNCGASMTAGATGICPSCGGKLTTGDFDWILSRIEQDEAYAG